MQMQCRYVYLYKNNFNNLEMVTLCRYDICLRFVCSSSTLAHILEDFYLFHIKVKTIAGSYVAKC